MAHHCHCPPDGSYYCDICSDLASRAGIIVPRKNDLLHVVPSSHPRESALSEARFLDRVRTFALAHGYLFYHTYSSKRSTPGWPDIVMVHATEPSPLYLWELKSTGGKVQPAQYHWMTALKRATSIDVRPCWPGDWGTMKELLTRRTP